jgi:anti-sigma regulatory factor (Ser/Thr protein kinase)
MSRSREKGAIMTEGKLSFEISNDLSQLKTLSENLEEYGMSIGLTQKTIFQMNLALDELVTNIITYGYTDDAQHWIQISISLKDGVLTIRIEDDGVFFNPVQARKPNTGCPIEEREIGGLGIHFMKHCVDEMVYERCGNKNILTLKKSLEEIEESS